MDPTSAISGFFAIVNAYMLVAATPGANFLVISQVGLTMSRAHAMYAALGVTGGAAGLSAISLAAGHALAASTNIVMALNLCFVLVLFYMGARLLIGSTAFVEKPATPPMSRSASFSLGLVTASTNPATATYFLTMVATPDCQTQSCGPLIGAAAVFVVTGIWSSAVAIIFSAPRLTTMHRRVRVWLNMVLGGALITYAAHSYFATAN